MLLISGAIWITTLTTVVFVYALNYRPDLPVILVAMIPIVLCAFALLLATFMLAVREGRAPEDIYERFFDVCTLCVTRCYRPHRAYEPEEQPETPQADAPPSIDHEHPMPGRGLQFLEMKDRREFSRNLQGAFEQTEEGIDIDEQVAIEQGLADEQGARIGAGSSNTNRDDNV